VVVVVEGTVATVLDVIGFCVVDKGADVEVIIRVVAVVDVEQDAKTNDVSIKHVINVKIILLFILISFLKFSELTRSVFLTYC
jgi:hypothetical protein